MFKKFKLAKLEKEIMEIKAGVYDIELKIKKAEVDGDTELAGILYDTRNIMIERNLLKHEMMFYIMN